MKQNIFLLGFLLFFLLQVTNGLDVVKKIQAQGTGGNGQPKTEVKITASGEL